MLDPGEYFLAFFGRLNEEAIRPLGFEYQNFGFLHDAISMRLVYSAADVFVGPSITEAFGKTIAEAMACGTPAVCFDSSGPKDIVDHQQNGYRARPFEAEDIANGIRWIMKSDYRGLSENARSKITTTFDSTLIAAKYKKLYEELAVS
jgi:glycosyltransferase involved in cell wall biosynthesis